MKIPPEKVREQLSPFGELKPQSIKDWTGEIPLPKAIEDFYREIGPVEMTIRGIGNDFFIPCLFNLWNYQEGYRYNKNERLEDWDDDWLVVADEGSDPFIFSIISGKILFAIHGQGIWEPDEIFPDINTMSACFGALGQILKKHWMDLDGEDGIKQEYLDQALHAISTFVGSDTEAQNYLENLGWC